MSGSVELHPLVQFVFQLGVLIVLTRIGGYWLRRWLRLPGVLGELIVGMLIGPYALGRFHWPLVGQLFPIGASGAPVSPDSRTGPHIQFLAEISRPLNDAAVRSKLLAATTPDEVLHLLIG